LCTVCGAPFPSREGRDHVCGGCIERPRNFRRARAAAAVTPAIRTLVHGLKYKGKIQLARPLGALMAVAFQRFWAVDGVDALLPVPLHPAQLRRRGFNQAFQLVRGWRSWCGLHSPERATLPVLEKVLERHRRTESQTGLDRADRMRNVRGAFRLIDAALVKGLRVLVVDDVYTTGATVDECAAVLLRGGAAEVDVITLARSIRR
jgi:ComF family protein